jgi:2-oxoisovalerate dehydrogenase E1 component
VKAQSATKRKRVAGSKPDKELLLGCYRTMVTIRKCEERLVRSFQAGLIYGGCHTYIGEEAVATGVSVDLRDDDLVFGTHRGHGHALAKGLAPVELFAELYGLAGGASGGRGGSMHLFKPEIGLMGTSGIVGPSILLAAGAAYSFKLAGSERVSVAYFGDGAVNNGAFHEGCNMATVWELPVLLVCENNLYATEVPFATVTKEQSVARKAQAYALPHAVVDGNDVREVYREAGQAIARARSGGGPTLLECRTYRQRAHAEGMRDSGYRTREEVEEWKASDPILALRTSLTDDGTASAEELDGLEAEVAGSVESANEAALASGEPDPATVLDHVVGGQVVGSQVVDVR